MAIYDFNTYKPIEVTSATDTPTISRALCFKITSGDDSTTGTGEVVLDWSNISSQADIGVYDENDNLLDYYFESFDATNETAVIWVYRDWVRDGSVQAKIAYGSGPSDQSVSASTVFDKESNLAAGYLFNESSGDLLDVTSNNNDGTVYGATQGESGIVGGAYSFDGSDDYVNIGLGSVIGTNRYTVEAWIYKASERTDNAAQLISGGVGHDNDGIMIRTEDYYSADAELANEGSCDWNNGWLNGSSIARGSSIPLNEWIYVAVDLTVVSTDGGDHYIGANNDGSNNYEGDICDFRISNGGLTADIISATYAATKSSPDFFSQKAVVVVGTDSPTNVTSTSATLNGTLEDLQGNSSLDVYFEYGTDTSYGNTTATQTISSVPTSFSADISGLTDLETYHYRAVATDGTNYWYGGDVSFYAVDLRDVDETQSEFQNGTLTDVVADSGDYLRLALAIDDDFASFDTNTWTKFGTGNGSVSVSNSELVIEQTAGGGTDTSFIGVRSNTTFGPGMSVKARVKSDSKRHHTVIGVGESGWGCYPHAGSSIGVTWYSRADENTSALSYQDESGNTGYDDTVTQDLTSYQTVELVWQSDGSTVDFYRNDTLEGSFSGLDFDANHYVYFSADGYDTPNRVLIDWVQVKGIYQGNRVVQLDLSSLSTYSDSLIEWTATLNGQSLTIETRYSLDGGSSWSSWQTATNGNPIPGLSSGDDLSDALLECRETLSTSDSTTTPQLEQRAIYIAETTSISISVNSAAQDQVVKVLSIARFSDIFLEDSIQSEVLSGITVSENVILSIYNAAQFQNLTESNIIAILKIIINEALQDQTLSKAPLSGSLSIYFDDIAQLEVLSNLTISQFFDVSLFDTSQSQSLANLDVGSYISIVINEALQDQVLDDSTLDRILSIYFNDLAQSETLTISSATKIVDGVLYSIIQNQREAPVRTLTGIGVFLSNLAQWQQDSSEVILGIDLSSQLESMSQQQLVSRMGDHIKLANMLQTQGLSADQVAKAHPVVVDSVGQWQEIRDIWPFAIRGVAIGDILQRQEANMLVLFVSGDTFFVILNGHENTFIEFNPYQAVHVNGQLEERTFISFDAYQAVEIINRRDKLWVAQ